MRWWKREESEGTKPSTLMYPRRADKTHKACDNDSDCKWNKVSKSWVSRKENNGQTTEARRVEKTKQD